MIEGYDPLWQAAMGTFFTWFVTAAGSAVVFFTDTGRDLLDASLGFSGGVMLAASYWSLLAPAIEMAEESGTYGAEGQWAFVPVAVGFAVGAYFVYFADTIMESMGVGNVVTELTAAKGENEQSNEKDSQVSTSDSTLRKRNKASAAATPTTDEEKDEAAALAAKQSSWKRTLLLAIAVTIHNIPEGLAVGVGFGAIGTVKGATFAKARNLAIGIGIQNFPEGLAVSLPLHRAGYSKWTSFWYGQMSGMVEPVAGILGALAVSYATPILPFALAFAAGAMVYVVVDDIVPEIVHGGNQKLGSCGCIVGFIVMMSLDVGLG
eukprot:m.142772 g.142772  ORF g.142772 m.142772 type:complete len:320 (+) comp30270_c0_seq1:271-1230(+)